MPTRKAKIKLELTEQRDGTRVWFSLDGKGMAVRHVLLPDPSSNPVGFAIGLSNALLGVVQKAADDIAKGDVVECQDTGIFLTGMTHHPIEIDASKFMRPEPGTVTEAIERQVPSPEAMTPEQEARQAHIAKANRLIADAQRGARQQAIPLIEMDPEVLAVSGESVQFSSPSPQIVREDGQPVVHDRPAHAGPAATTGGSPDGAERRGNPAPLGFGLGNSMAGGEYSDGDEIRYDEIRYDGFAGRNEMA